MLPVQYTPKHEVVTFDDQIYVIDSSNLDRFTKDLEDSKFVKIENSRVAVSSIKVVRPANQEVSILERLLSGKPDHIKMHVRDKIREREKEGKKATEKSIQNVIDYFEQ